MIKPQDLKIIEDIITPEEIKKMEKLEDYIDAQIKKTWNGKKASVYKGPEFNLWGFREDILIKLVKQKYVPYWDIKEEIGEDDGPNRPGADFWIFTRKD